MAGTVTVKVNQVNGGWIVYVGEETYVAKTQEELGSVILKGFGVRKKTAPAKPRRKRRTKAEIAADNAAKAAAEAKTE